MALGTPVAAAAAYSGTGGGAGTVSPAYPSGILATDVVLLFIGQKPATANGGGLTAPSGWTLRESLTGAGGYGATLGADTGNTNLYCYSWDTPVAGQTGNLSISLTDNNVSWAFMIRIPTGGNVEVFGSADGSRTTAPTSGTAYTVTLTNGTTAPNLKSGDLAIWAMCIPTDVLGGTGFSAHTITSTGTTFGTVSEFNEPSSGTANDIGGYSAWASATAGSSTAAPVVGATATGTVTNVRGPIVLVRVRELPFIDAASTSFTYTGQNTTDRITRGINAEAGSFTYTGQDATLTKTAAPILFNAEAGSFTYTGQNTTDTIVRAVNAEAGSFTYTGQDATTTATRSLNAEAGAFTYTGQDATLTPARSLNAEAGAFTYTGQDATLNRTYSFNAEAGTFTYTGQDATLLYVAARSIDAEAGTFAVTGQDATLNRTYSFDAQAGSFAYTGQAAVLAANKVVNAESGTFTYAGQAATLVSNRALNAEAGAFAYTGQDATLEYASPNKEINAEAGSFAYTGQNAALIYAQAAPILDAQPGAFTVVGQDAFLVRDYRLNAESGAFGEADPYVDPGYVDPYYSTNLTATLLRSRVFDAAAGSFTITGQAAALNIWTLYPPESDVRAGVIYGPGGIYMGTYVPATKQPLYIFDD